MAVASCPLSCDPPSHPLLSFPLACKTASRHDPITDESKMNLSILMTFPLLTLTVSLLSSPHPPKSVRDCHHSDRGLVQHGLFFFPLLFLFSSSYLSFNFLPYLFLFFFNDFSVVTAIGSHTDSQTSTLTSPLLFHSPYFLSLFSLF